MSREKFRNTQFKDETLARIAQLREIISEYGDQRLTARPGPKPRTMSQIVRAFLEQITIGDDEACWPWTGYVNKRTGYGSFQARQLSKQPIYAHRFAYELARGNPRTLHVLHRCDNPVCCNPGHLFLGTQLDNNKDRDAKGRTASGDHNGSRTKPDRVARGERNGHARLTVAEVQRIRRAIGTQRTIAHRFGVCQQTVSDIKRGKRWGHT